MIFGDDFCSWRKRFGDVQKYDDSSYFYVLIVCIVLVVLFLVCGLMFGGVLSFV